MKVRCLFIVTSKSHLLHSSFTEKFAARLGSGTLTEVSSAFPNNQETESEKSELS